MHITDVPIGSFRAKDYEVKQALEIDKWCLMVMVNLLCQHNVLTPS